MKALNFFLLVAVISVALSSCIVQAPYATNQDVLNLQPGMTLAALEDSLKLDPYYVEHHDHNGTRVLVYQYRVNDLKRLPLVQKKNKGWEVPGSYMDLLVSVGPDDIVYALETRKPESTKATRTTVIDFRGIVGGITTMLTVTLPALFVFLSNGN